MRVGLVAVDGRKYPNLALGKLSTWHKQQGDSVEWADPMFGEYDSVYMSKIFNFTPDDTYTYNTKEIIKGGTGYGDYNKVLSEEIDRLQPDYTLYPYIDSKTAYGFLTRGCPRRCNWCIVHKKEGNIKPYMDIDEVTMNGKRPNAILMDNNILACEYGIFQLEKIADKGYIIDLNQGCDARLVTDDIAKILARIKWKQYIRFAADTKKEIEDVDRAMAMIDYYSDKSINYFIYTMIHGDISECLERLNHFKKNPKTRVGAQPFRDLKNPNYKPPQWQKDMAHWANKTMCFKACEWEDFSPRVGFKCKEYFK